MPVEDGARPDLQPISEDDPGQPESLYPLTKWAAEALARRFAHLHRLDLAAVRLASPLGPSSATRARVRSCPRYASGRGPPSAVSPSVSRARPPRGETRYTWRTSRAASPPSSSPSAYRDASAEDVLAALRPLVPGLAVELCPDEPSPWSGSVPRGPLSIDRLRQDLGWSPRLDLASGLAAYVEWVRANPSLA